MIYNNRNGEWRVDLYSFVKRFVIDNRFNLNQIFWDEGKAIFEKWPDIKYEINNLENNARKIYNADVKQHNSFLHF